MSDLDFYFDPICPFAWLTSKWVRQVAALRDYDVEWRFISLRMINRDADYETQFPPSYDALHTTGLRLLRVAASVRASDGPAGVAALYLAYGTRLWDGPPDLPAADRLAAVASECLAAAGLPTDHTSAVEDEAFDELIQAEGEQALSLTGKDVGTPILHIDPPHGTAFFGPVISRLPSDEDAVALWDHVLGLSRFAGFAELKRSLREMPQLRALGVEPDQVGAEQEWRLPRA